MGNCSQVNNTTIKGTSAVTYDSTPLPCTDVNTCDGLNTILKKFDDIICSVKANVDTLTEDVMNLTEDVMVITEDITNINNQLDICCPTTTTTTTLPPTTTTTTTVEPTTTTTTSSSSTTTSTSTSTSTSTTTSTSTSTSTSTTTSTTSSTSTTTSTSSSTTTTTTTVSPPLEGCYNVTFDATVECVGDPGHAVIEYTDCSGTNQTASIPLSGTQTYCVLLGPTSLEPAFTCGNGTVTLGSECGTTTTTTTSEPTVGLSGTWDLDSVNGNVEITSINNLNGQTVSCINATSCGFPIVSGGGQYIATPPTTDGTTPITSPSTASLMLNLSWTSFIPGATYWFSITVDSNPGLIQNVTYGTPVVTVSVPGIVTGAENVTILFTGTI